MLLNLYIKTTCFTVCATFKSNFGAEPYLIPCLTKGVLANLASDQVDRQGRWASCSFTYSTYLITYCLITYVRTHRHSLDQVGTIADRQGPWASYSITYSTY